MPKAVSVTVPTSDPAVNSETVLPEAPAFPIENTKPPAIGWASAEMTR